MMLEHALTRYQMSDLAMDAAIELQKIKSSNDGDFDVINRFLVALKDQWVPKNENSILKYQSLYPVYAYALSKSGDTSFVNTSDLGTKISEIISPEIENSSDDARIEYLRDFCLAVHEALLSELTNQRLASEHTDERTR